MDLAEKLKRAREAKGFTQQRLADKMGAVKATVYKLETGRMQITEDWLMRICAALGITPDDVIGSEPPPPVNPFLLATCFGATMKEYGEGRNLMAQAQMAAWLYEKLRADKDNAKLDAYVAEWREHEAARNAQDTRWHRGEDAPVR